MTINPELCTWWFGKRKYEKPSVPYNTALTTWSTQRIFTAVFTFVFMSQLISRILRLQLKCIYRFKLALNNYIWMSSFSCLIQKYPFKGCLRCFAHLFQHFFCTFFNTPVVGTGWSSSPVFRPSCLLIARRRKKLFSPAKAAAACSPPRFWFFLVV